MLLEPRTPSPPEPALGSNADIGCTAPKTQISRSEALAIQLCPKVRWHAVRLRRGKGADRNAKGDNQDHDC